MWMRWGAQVVKSFTQGTTLAVQWLGLHASKARGTSSIPGGDLRSESHVVQSEKKKCHPRQECAVVLSSWVPDCHRCELGLFPCSEVTCRQFQGRVYVGSAGPASYSPCAPGLCCHCFEICHNF